MDGAQQAAYAGSPLMKQSGYNAEVARQPHHLEMVLSRLQQVEQRLNHVGAAASSVADRLIGPVPEQVGEGSRPPIGGGLFHQLEQQVALIEAAVDRAERQVGRLV